MSNTIKIVCPNSESGEIMQQAKKLRVISFSGIGVAQFVDLPQARKQNITVCSCPGYSNNTNWQYAQMHHQ